MGRTSDIAASIAITVAVLGLGGVHTEVVSVAAFAALGAMLFAVLHQRAGGHRVLFSLVGASMGLAALLCAVQLVPVPEIVHAVLNPRGWEIYEHGATLAGLPTSWRPLSLDPGATADRMLRYAALAGIAVWAANVRGRRRWRQFGYGLVPLALVTLALGAGLHFSGTKSFFGLYEPTVGGFRGPSTFINLNHAAVFYGLAALVAKATALGLRRDNRAHAFAFGVASVVLVVGALFMDSDGVLLAFAATAVVAALTQWLRMGRPTDVRKDVKIGVGVLAVLAAILGLWLDLHRVVLGFFDRVVYGGEHGGRLELMSAGLAASADFWRFGAGAGSVESVVPAYVDWSSLIPASIPLVENDPLELVLSFGLGFGAIICGAVALQLAAVLRRGTDGQHSARYAVAIVAGTFMLLVAQIHFPLFALGIALPAIAWFELLWSRRAKPSKDARVFRTGHVALGSAGALVVVATLGLLWAGGVHAHFRAYAPRLPSAPDVHAHHVWLQPGDHVPYVKLATRALDDDPEQALALAEFAVSREPSPRVRLYRAEVLARVDGRRGAAEFGRLFEEGHVDGRFIEHFVRATKSAQLRAEIVAPHPAIWGAVASRIRQLEGADPASSFVVELANQRPNNLLVYRLASRIYLELGEPALSELWAQLVREAEGRSDTQTRSGPLLLAQALHASGRTEEARRVLEASREHPRLDPEAHRLALELRGPVDAARLDVIVSHFDAYCVSPIPAARRAVCWATEGWIAEARREHGDAERVYTRIHRRLGDVRPLAEFYVRAGRCEDLEAIERELEPGAARVLVEAFLKRCNP